MSPDGSKYVRETGPGYEGIVRVSDGGANLCLNTIDAADWPAETSVGFYEADRGLRALPTEATTAEPVGSVGVVYHDRKSGRRLSIPTTAVQVLDVADGSDIRIYVDDAPGLVLVAAAEDPHVDGGGRA